MPRLRETEEGFQDAVIQLARNFGWRVHHTRRAWSQRGWRTPIQGDKGFFDLVLARQSEFILAELKVPPNVLSADQCDWYAVLQTTGIEVYVWYPRDFDFIAERLGPRR